MNKKTFALIIVLIVAFALASFAFGLWLVVSGIQGARDNGASTWEVFKIVLGVCWLGSTVFGGSRSRD